MTEDDVDDFTRLLETCGELCDQTVSPGRQAMYFNILKRFELRVIQKAIEIYFGTGDKYRRFPQPNQLIEIIEGSEEDAEAHAWTTMIAALRQIGSWMTIIVEDPALADAIVMTFGSWAACGSLTEAALNARRRDFVAVYRRCRATMRGSMLGMRGRPRLLLGQADAQNGPMAASWAAIDKRHFGVIYLDGRIVDRYLDIEQSTGLPASSLADVLALPPAAPVPALSPAPAESDQELSPEDARAVLTAAFAELTVRTQMPAIAREPLTRADEAARRKDLRAQARRWKRDARHERHSLSGSEAEASGSVDRATDPRRETS